MWNAPAVDKSGFATFPARKEPFCRFQKRECYGRYKGKKIRVLRSKNLLSVNLTVVELVLALNMHNIFATGR